MEIMSRVSTHAGQNRNVCLSAHGHLSGTLRYALPVKVLELLCVITCTCTCTYTMHMHPHPYRECGDWEEGGCVLRPQEGGGGRGRSQRSCDGPGRQFRWKVFGK